ncbi:MAG TPA: methyltransferase domain-containing protein [Pyrinomonadaceae bacterium]
MAEITDSEIDVGQLMAEIRAAAAEREREGRKSLLGATLEIQRLLDIVLEFQEPPAEIKPLKLQPNLERSEDDHYHVNDFLKFHDHLFVWNAYRAILKREPDEPGLQEFLGKLRSGRFSKIDILSTLVSSPEGRRNGVRIDGLGWPAFFRKLYRVPLIGYFFELFASIARLPMIVRGQRQFEGHTSAQQDVLAIHINQLSHLGFQVAETFSRELEQIHGEQRAFTTLSSNQAVSLFHDQRETVEQLRRLRNDVNARLAQLEKKVKSGRAQADEAADESEMDDLMASFADEFRGSREEVKEKLRVYLPLLKQVGIKRDVLDLGCGLGEWLELLREQGIEARGIDINHLLIERAHGLGLEVIQQDALSHLRGLPNDSLSAITGFQFIEHLRFADLLKILSEILRVLKPSGLVIFETPNPKNLVVGACNFYSDPTHARPLFPETVQFILRKLGFDDVHLEYVNAVADSPFKDDTEATRALDTWFYSPRDFAVIGRKN